MQRKLTHLIEIFFHTKINVNIFVHTIPVTFLLVCVCTHFRCHCTNN